METDAELKQIQIDKYTRKQAEQQNITYHLEQRQNKEHRKGHKTNARNECYL